MTLLVIKIYNLLRCLNNSGLSAFNVLFYNKTRYHQILAEDTHNIEKRQIGVLARTGALPQGKRSLEVLARNGELPQLGGKKDSSEDTKDLLIEELDRAESLSHLRAQALAEKLIEEREFERFGSEKRSVAALARNGDLPQKRLSETINRLGYLIRPPQETAQPVTDLFDPDDFPANEQSSELMDERSFKSKRNSGTNMFYKKNLASLARDGGFDSLRHPKERKAVGEVEITNDDFKRNVGAAKNFDKREIFSKCWNYPTIEAMGKGYKNGRFGMDYEDMYPELNNERMDVGKRFLGRIPQLGRVQQKVQAPSSRRRPHLRPNWL